jgi:hypothetical protein
MVVTLPALSSNGLPPLPAAIAPAMAAVVVLVLLLCAAVALLSRLGVGPPARRHLRLMRTSRGRGPRARWAPTAMRRRARVLIRRFDSGKIC